MGGPRRQENELGKRIACIPLRFPRPALHSPYSKAEVVVVLRLRPSGRRTKIPTNLGILPLRMGRKWPAIVRPESTTAREEQRTRTSVYRGLRRQAMVDAPQVRCHGLRNPAVASNEKTKVEIGSKTQNGFITQINQMDEGEGERGLIYLSFHEIRSLQYVVKTHGRAVSLPGHEVLRQQESPSLDLFPTDSTGTRQFDLLVSNSIHYS